MGSVLHMGDCELVSVSEEVDSLSALSPLSRITEGPSWKTKI